MKPFSDRLRRWRGLCLRLIAFAMIGAMLCSAAAEGAQAGGSTAPLSATPAPGDAALASAAVAPGVHLYAIVSDMRAAGETVLRSHRLYYAMVLMSVAIELKESGELRGMSLCAAQAQADGFQEITGEPDAMALQLYRAMEGMKRAGDELSINTWEAIEKALDQSAEEGTRPVILLLYGDDIHRITPGRNISEKVNRSGVKLFYLEGKQDIFFDGFRKTLGLRPEMLPVPTEAPAETASAEATEAPTATASPAPTKAPGEVALPTPTKAPGEVALPTPTKAPGEVALPPATGSTAEVVLPPVTEAPDEVALPPVTGAPGEVALPPVTEAPAEDESDEAVLFYARCGKADAWDSETMQKLVAAIVREVLGRERSVSPFQLLAEPASYLSIQSQNSNKTVYSFSHKDLNPNIDVMLINLKGVEEIKKRSASSLVDASASKGTVFSVNLHPELQAVEGQTARADAAPEETAAPSAATSQTPDGANPTPGPSASNAAPSAAASQTPDGANPTPSASASNAAPSAAASQTPDGSNPTPGPSASNAAQMPVALDQPVSSASATSQPQEGEAEAKEAEKVVPVGPTVAPDETGDPDYIATVQGRRIRGRGILVHESQVIRAQLDAQKVLEALQSAQLIWPQEGENDLTVNFSAVDAEQLRLLDGGEYRASVHVFHGEQEVCAANFNSSVASRPLVFTIEDPGTYHVKMAVAHERTQVEGDVGEEFGKDNQRPQIVGDAEISLGTFVVAQAGDVLGTLELGQYFTDDDVGSELRYYVNVAPLEGSALTIRAGEIFGTESCIVQASDSIDFSNMLTITWTTLSAQELMASSDFELSVTPEQIYKGTQGEISATAALPEADEIQNLDQLEAAWAGTELTVKFVGKEEGSAALPDVTLAPAGRGEDGRWLWKGSFTAPTERSGDYEIELYCGEQRLNEGASDELHMVNRAPQKKQGAQLKIDEKQEDFQQTTKELKLADVIDAEPNDVLRIQISSTRSQFKLDEETDTLEQQEEVGGGESGTMTWDVAEEPDRSLTVSISHFNQPNRAKGSLILDVEDQEGESSKVEIPYNVGNSKRDAHILPLIALALAALVALFIALGGVYLYQKKRGPRI